MKISPTASYFKFLFSPHSLYRHSLMCMAQCLCSLCSYICIQSNVPNVLLLYKWHLVSWIFDLLLTVLYHKRNNFWVQLNSYMCMPFTCSKQWKRHVMYNCKNNQNKLSFKISNTQGPFEKAIMINTELSTDHPYSFCKFWLKITTQWLVYNVCDKFGT